jgi:circadian clock protein KaiB
MTMRGGHAASRSDTAATDTFLLRLYIAGRSQKSMTALNNLNRICEERLQGRYRVEVIDLLEDPLRASADQILAIPTLVRSEPAPAARIIGDLSDRERVLSGLNIG